MVPFLDGANFGVMLADIFEMKLGSLASNIGGKLGRFTSDAFCGILQAQFPTSECKVTFEGNSFKIFFKDTPFEKVFSKSFSMDLASYLGFSGLPVGVGAEGSLQMRPEPC